MPKSGYRNLTMDIQNNAKNDTDTLHFMAEGLLQLAGLQSIPCLGPLKAVSTAFLERYSSNTFEGENERLLMGVKSPSLPVTMFLTVTPIAESLSIPYYIILKETSEFIPLL